MICAICGYDLDQDYHTTRNHFLQQHGVVQSAQKLLPNKRNQTMAITNIRREPQREITETAVGIAVFAIVPTTLYFLGSYLHRAGYADSTPEGSALALLIIIIVPLSLPLAAISLFLAVSLVHHIGEGVCNSLQNKGIHLRPRHRPDAKEAGHG